MQAISSCQAAKNLISSTVSGAYTLTISGTNYNVWCEMVGSNGWTLVLKADGNDNSWHYDSSIWSNQNTYNPSEFANGLAKTSFKSPMYWLHSFSQLRIGLQFPRYDQSPPLPNCRMRLCHNSPFLLLHLLVTRVQSTGGRPRTRLAVCSL